MERIPGGFLQRERMDAMTEFLMDRPLCTVAAIVCGVLLLAHLMMAGIEVD